MWHSHHPSTPAHSKTALREPAPEFPTKSSQMKINQGSQNREDHENHAGPRPAKAPIGHWHLEIENKVKPLCFRKNQVISRIINPPVSSIKYPATSPSARSPLHPGTVALSPRQQTKSSQIQLNQGTWPRPPRHWILGVRCWMFRPFQISNLKSPLPLPDWV